MTNKIVTIDSLSRMAQAYAPTLRTLPFHVLIPELKKMGINILETDKKDTHLEFQRKGGLSRPYVIGDDMDDLYAGSVGKIIERDLELKTCVLVMKDHIKNYEDKKVISNAGEKVNNKTKNHPLEALILESIIRTVAEDTLMAIPSAERIDALKNPLGMFDGMDTIIDADITASRITVANGNLIELGATPFETPVDDTDYTAWENLVKFVRALNPFLRQNGMLYLTYKIYWAALDALGNKMKAKDTMEWDVFMRKLQSIAGAPGLKMVVSPILGTGDRIHCQIPGNMDFGLNTLSDLNFMQVRNPFEDANLIQFWVQWDAGYRIRSTHRKTFAVSDGTAVADATISGDYQS